ncbi:MAG: PQQ-dependent sugar dehydrogenase [Pseudomonadales bacterium]|nr:PQQ-dependent sugar dehydrogenase [Pseudomonadales bacterium]
MNLKLVISVVLIWFVGQPAYSNYEIETVAEGLDFPWSVAFLPNGDLLVAELSGNVRRISNGTVGDPIANVPEVFRMSQGGLFDVLLDPEYETTQQIYLSYAEGDIDSNATTVIRARLVDNALTEVTEIYSASPRKYGPVHYGGRMDWSADGNLLLTTGDGFDFREKAQDVTEEFGKTILIQIGSGVIPPFPEAPLVLSYGHRNPQGLAVAEDGTIYQHEHGPSGGDEINIIEPGKNYGWPVVTYGMDYNGAYVSPFTEREGMTQPIHVWVPSIAPSGLIVYEGEMFPEWRGNLFIGALVDQEVRRLEMDGRTVTNETVEFPEISARIRDIREAPDGSIYVLTDGNPGSVLRVAR